ncbi:hypothetical protein [Nocardia stercoris]|uniref:SCP2 domain-containing protein n=1 Tax=Nocardia stercoris TaxID=2483361 RepID=A0A3M2L715_9NOCA|nr:hypothetical protein [Nocardia stercoris]RMI33439.1 hypothetical protein EBN03_09870 [Nocardia stercoris]
MTSPGTFEYVGPQWLEAVAAIVADLLGDDPGPLDYCVCEDLTSPPPGRANTPAGTLSWSIHFHTDGTVVGAGSPATADLRIVADYAVHHALSRQIWAGDPEIMAAAQQRRRSATAAGELRIEGDMSAAPDPIRRLIAQLHDPVAEITA